uniref:Uncharacterized protein n=1 Tax=Magallana gigas TaxID=29159 RepID=K1QVD2_MAGGI
MENVDYSHAGNAKSDEGSVYFSALSPHLSSHGQCNFSLLYPTSKPIKNIQSSRIALREKTNPGPDSALDRKVINGLVICSSNGDSTVLTCDKKYGAQYVPFTVPCSINDVKIVGTKMYVSSGEDLLVADFALLEKDDKYYVEMDKMTSLKFAGALKIHCVLDTSLVEETVSHILCGTESGRVSEIDVGLRLKQPATQRTQEQGRHIKELLTAIENCQLQIQRLTCKEDRQKEFISQLNVALYLMNSERLFQCEYSVLQKVKDMDAVLRFLTQPCQQPVNIENHEAKLVDTTGEPVKISIQMLDTDTGISMLKLIIISREITLAAAVREAISRYLQITDKALVDEHIPKEYLLKGTLSSSDLSSALISSVTKGDVVNVYRRLRCGHAE